MTWLDGPLCDQCHCPESIHDLYGCTHCPGCDRPLVEGNALPPPEPEIDPRIALFEKRYMTFGRKKPKGPRP